MTPKLKSPQKAVMAKYHATRYKMRTRKDDPFRVLPDNVVGLIIQELPAVETEKIRRVSKTWKATSEFFNANLALRTHFPMAMTKALVAPTEPNLEFRRLLYQQESLRNGYARRLLHYEDVVFWHTNNHRLAIFDTSGDFIIREFRNQSNLAIDVGEIFNVSVFSKVMKPEDITGLWILEDGNILVQAYVIGDTKDAASHLGFLARLKPHSSDLISWAIFYRIHLCGTEFTPDFSRGDGHALPSYAVGKTEIYEMRHEQLYESQSFRWVSTLVVRDLDQPKEEYMIQRYEHSGYRNWTDCRMTLTGDGKFLILKNEKGVVDIVSTVNGTVQNISSSSRKQAQSQIATSCIIGTSSSGFCEYRARLRFSSGKFACSTYRYNYDIPSASFIRKKVHAEDRSASTLNKIHDWDRGITFFSKRRHIWDTDHTTINSQYMSFELHKTRAYRPTLGDLAPGVRQISLLDPRDGQRTDHHLLNPKAHRLFPFTGSGQVPYSDSFMGMIDGYFMNLDTTYGLLVVYDFWPSW